MPSYHASAAHLSVDHDQRSGGAQIFFECSKSVFQLKHTWLTVTEPLRCNTIKPADRQECGFPGIGRQDCIDHGCCYNSSLEGVRWCFRSGKWSLRVEYSDFETHSFWACSMLIHATSNFTRCTYRLALGLSIRQLETLHWFRFQSASAFSEAINYRHLISPLRVYVQLQVQTNWR